MSEAWGFKSVRSCVCPEKSDLIAQAGESEILNKTVCGRHKRGWVRVLSWALHRWQVLKRTDVTCGLCIKKVSRNIMRKRYADRCKMMSKYETTVMNFELDVSVGSVFVYFFALWQEIAEWGCTFYWQHKSRRSEANASVRDFAAVLNWRLRVGGRADGESAERERKICSAIADRWKDRQRQMNEWHQSLKTRQMDRQMYRAKQSLIHNWM